MPGYLIVYVTCKSREEGLRIGNSLVERRLVACVNIVPGIESIFWWDGKLQVEEEVLLIMKTKKAAFETLLAEVKKLHSYDVPEIIGIPIEKGSEEYLRWIEEEVKLPE